MKTITIGVNEPKAGHYTISGPNQPAYSTNATDARAAVEEMVFRTYGGQALKTLKRISPKVFECQVPEPKPSPSAGAELIPLNKIIRDTSLQMRHTTHERELDWDFVDGLTDALADTSHDLHPVTLFSYDAPDGTEQYYIGDGWHRLSAYQAVHREKIPAIVHEGGRDAAFRFALGANADQCAKPRTRKDLRKAVTKALLAYYFALDAASKKTQCVKIPKGKRLTMEQIAEICKTTQQTVSRIAKDVEREHAPKPPATEPGGAPAAPVQIDFWDEFRQDFSELIVKTREKLKDKDRWEHFQKEPERAAEELEAFAEAMAQEVREIREAVKSIRIGIAASKKEGAK